MTERTHLQLARYLLEGMEERKQARYSRGELGVELGWQTEVNEIRRILEYIIDSLEPKAPAPYVPDPHEETSSAG